jgi:hypothetical protein
VRTRRWAPDVERTARCRPAPPRCREFPTPGRASPRDGRAGVGSGRAVGAGTADATR